MNPCTAFIMTCAEVTALTPGSYIPVKKILPVLYERIGEKPVKQMLAAGVIANYHGRMQKSVILWAETQLSTTSRNTVYWPELSTSVLYDLAKEVIKSEKRKEAVSGTV